MKRLFGSQSGVVAAVLVTLVVATLLFLGVSYLAHGSPSDLRSATAKAERLKAQARELQDSTRTGGVFVKGWFAQPTTRRPVTDCAQTLVQGVRSHSVPLSDPLASLTRCQAALELLQSEQTTIATPAYTDPSLATSQKTMVALYDSPIAEVRQTIGLIVKWRGLTLRQRGDAVGLLQETARRSLAQSDAATARQRQVALALARSQSDDAEVNRQIDEAFAQARGKVVGSLVMVVLAVVLAAVSIAFALWRRARTRASVKTSGSEGEG